MCVCVPVTEKWMFIMLLVAGHGVGRHLPWRGVLPDSEDGPHTAAGGGDWGQVGVERESRL